MSGKSGFRKSVFTLSFIAVTVLVISSFAVYRFYNYSVTSAVDNMRDDLSIIALSTSDSIEDYLFEHTVMLEAFAEKEFVQLITWPESKIQFAKYAQSTGVIEWLIRLDKSGRILLGHPTLAVNNANFFDDDFFESVKDKKTIFIDDFSDDELTGGTSGVVNSVIIAVPIYTDEGFFDGALAAVYSIDDIAHKFIYPLTSQKAYSWAVSDKGIILAHSDKSAVGTNLNTVNIGGDITQLLHNIKSSRKSSAEYIKDGDKKIAVTAPLTVGQLSWSTVYTSSLSNVRMLIYPIFKKLLILSLIIITIIISSSVFIFYKLREVSILKEKILSLEIEIDEQRKDREVKEITGSDYFQELAAKVEELKKDC